MAKNKIEHPDYYNRGIEMWDYAYSHNLDFFEGNIVKYVTRHRTKGEGAKDIQKIIHYAQMILELRYGEDIDATAN